MTWSINWDASNGNQWANTVGGHLSALPGGTGPSAPPTTVPPTTVPPTSCAGVSAWNATTPHGGGSVVAYNGHRWTAKWWTQGDVPGNNSQNVWTDNGSC